MRGDGGSPAGRGAAASPGGALRPPPQAARLAAARRGWGREDSGFSPAGGPLARLPTGCTEGAGMPFGFLFWRRKGVGLPRSPGSIGLGAEERTLC